jgi:replication factor A1
MFDTAKEAGDNNLVQGASETISYLKRIGASVSIRANMHEKLAVIDLKIWWIGSLNIFSHAYTHEGMIRIQGLEKTIQNLVDEILRAPRRERKPRTRISQLSDGMKGLVVEGSIVASSPARNVRGGKKVAEAFLSDGTGTIKLVLWEEQIKQVRQGMMVRIENCYVSSFRGTLQLNPGKYGRIRSKKERSL